MNICLLLSRILGSKKGPPPTPTYTISGAIVDGAAAGIEGATVALTGDATDSTTTAADGTYSFTGVVDGSYTVTPTYTAVTFTPASRDGSVSGANVALDSFTGTMKLPLALNFTSDTVGQAPSGWVDLEAGFAPIVANSPADVSSYNPSLKVLQMRNDAGGHCKVYYRFALNGIPSGTAIKLEVRGYCADNSADDLRLYLGQTASVDAAGRIYNRLSDVQNRWYTGGSDGSNNVDWEQDTTSASMDLDRWFKVQFVFRPAAQTISREAYRLQDAAKFADHPLDLTGVGGVSYQPTLKFLLLDMSNENANSNDIYISQVFVGYESDVWP